MNEKTNVESVEVAKVEEKREMAVFMPASDIVETPEMIRLRADMPGVDEESVEVSVEKSVLTLRGKVDSQVPEGYSLSRLEYEVGDFERSFRLSDEIDHEAIRASVRHGVLELEMPKRRAARQLIEVVAK